jgi:thiol peroxidase
MADKRTVQLEGNDLHLHDDPPEVGDQLPGFRVVEDIPEEIEFDGEAAEGVHIITSAISVDTPVCAKQFESFDEHAAGLEDEGIHVWYVSRDLPFALKRYAQEHDLDHIRFVSDYKFGEFGRNTGLAIQESALLSRATLVVDADGTVVYREVLDEISEEPDYEAAIEAAREANRG